MSDKPTLKIEFDSEEALEHFAVWMSEEGEQTYWGWMEVRESEEDGPITAVRFNYHTPGITPGRESFVADQTIRTVCGRLDDES